MYSKTTPQKQTQAPKYPCLMIGKDGTDIVLFHKEKEGIVVGLPSENYHIGHYNNEWAMRYFVPYNGTVTLSNTKID